jgi:hypothetical protein
VMFSWNIRIQLVRGAQAFISDREFFEHLRVIFGFLPGLPSQFLS